MSSKVEKTRARLQKRIEEGAYYEAHQQLRVLSQRYVKAENYETAIDILFTGAQALLKAGQGSSGGDLVVLLIDTYNVAEIKPGPEPKARIITLIGLISPEEPIRKKVIKEAVAWSSKLGEFPSGDPELQHYIGSLYAEEGDAAEAEKHLLVGTRNSVDVLAPLLYRWYTNTLPLSIDASPLFLARAIIPYLLLRNVRDAIRAYEIFTKLLLQDNPGLQVQEVQSSTSEAKVFPTVMGLNFLGLLVLGAQRGGPEVWRSLKGHYAGWLREVGGWEEPLEQIAEIYFGIRIQRPTNFLDMMGSMFGGGAPSQPQLPQSAQIAPPAELD